MQETVRISDSPPVIYSKVPLTPYVFLSVVFLLAMALYPLAIALLESGEASHPLMSDAPMSTHLLAQRLSFILCQEEARNQHHTFGFVPSSLSLTAKTGQIIRCDAPSVI